MTQDQTIEQPGQAIDGREEAGIAGAAFGKLASYIAAAHYDCFAKTMTQNYAVPPNTPSANPAADSIEQEIQAKGLTAPRVTPADIEANIEAEVYFTAAEAADNANGVPSMHGFREKYAALCCLTFCVLILKNGFIVTGESACASPENFDAEVGRKIARQNAIQKIWPLMGYELRTKLAAA